MPESCPTRFDSSARARRVRSRSSSKAQPASFQPNVVGSAWMPCERPMQIESRCSSACLTTAASAGRGRRGSACRPPGSGARARCRRRPTRSARSAPSGLRARAARRPRRRRPRGRGRSSARSRRRARASGPLPSPGIAATSPAGIAPDLGPAVERRQLDLEPACELALLRPDPAHLGPGVAGDHRETV